MPKRSNTVFHRLQRLRVTLRRIRGEISHLATTAGARDKSHPARDLKLQLRNARDLLVEAEYAMTPLADFHVDSPARAMVPGGPVGGAT